MCLCSCYAPGPPRACNISRHRPPQVDDCHPPALNLYSVTCFPFQFPSWLAKLAPVPVTSEVTPASVANSAELSDAKRHT